MLRREDELRLSFENQQLYKRGGYAGYVKVTEDIQQQVAAEFNLSQEVGVMVLQCAESLVPPEEGQEGLNLVIEASLYRRFNRMRDGNLQIGDAAPDLNADLTLLESNQSDKLANTGSSGSSTNTNGSITGGKSRVNFTTRPIRFRDLVPLAGMPNSYRPTVIIASSHS